MVERKKKKQEEKQRQRCRTYIPFQRFAPRLGFLHFSEKYKKRAMKRMNEYKVYLKVNITSSRREWEEEEENGQKRQNKQHDREKGTYK